MPIRWAANEALSQFEFILTGFSIVLALSIARLLDGLRPTFAPGRFFWIHAVWVIIKLLDTTVYFWAAWINRDIGSWSFTDYLILIASPGILYLQANALVTTQPDAVDDWRDHYFSVHRWFFVANFLLAPVGLLAAHLAAHQPFPNASTVAFGIVAVLSMAAAVSSNSRVHAAVAVLSMANNALVYAYLSQLGAR